MLNPSFTAVIITESSITDLTTPFWANEKNGNKSNKIVFFICQISIKKAAREGQHAINRKPDSVPKRALSFIYTLHYCKAKAAYPPRLNELFLFLVYMALHRIEFAWFHYSRTVLAFCCTSPHLTMDGCYPLCCSMVSGLSSSEEAIASFIAVVKIRIY